MLPRAIIPALVGGALLALFGFYLMWTEYRDERRNRRS
jgi:hypothetical protein